MAKDLIILSGAPGSGKTTIAKRLRTKLNHSPYIEFGRFREFHLLPDWSNQSKVEKEMAFENLLFTLQNYLNNGYENIIVTDLHDNNVLRLVEHFENNNVAVFTLTLDDEQEHAKRIRGESRVGERDSGFTDVEAAFGQRKYLEREKLACEHFIENSHLNPDKTVEEIISIVK